METHKLVEKNTSAPYFQSLQKNYREYLKHVDSEQYIRDNELNFVQGATANISGPRKYMNEKEKLKIHQDIDDRMQELEDTGLTRMEVLFDNMEGKGC